MNTYTRALFVRNLSVAVVNGAITLIILLIAPLGLAAVITCTAFITASTFLVCTVGDVVIQWLLGGVATRSRTFERSNRDSITPPPHRDIEERRRD